MLVSLSYLHKYNHKKRERERKATLITQKLAFIFYSCMLYIVFKINSLHTHRERERERKRERKRKREREREREK